MDRGGLSLLEVLVAMVVIGIAFLALAMSQVSNLRATVNTQALTQLKAAANRAVEEQMSAILQATEVTPPDWYDAEDVYTDAYDNEQTRYLRFFFIDYYYGCPDPVSDPPRTLRDIPCIGTSTNDEGVTVDWTLRGRSGVEGEGLLDIIVTATHDEGSKLTIGDVVTCYEVYPAPTSEAPVPCPEPTATGGGR